MRRTPNTRWRRRTSRRTAHAGVAIALALATAAACSGDDDGAGNANKAGASGPVTLTIGTDDVQGRPAANQIEEFARQVDERSEGRIRIEPVWQAAGPGQDDWDQQIARMVAGGELDMAMVPARAWDTEGVTSLRALHAPLLVDSEELVGEIVTGDLAGDMLAGLDEAGVTGLALLPEGLRHIFSFGEPVLVPGDLEGGTVRSPMSATTFALFEALGATPDDLDGGGFSEALMEGEVMAADSSFALAPELPAPTVATGNLTLFPKVNSLVVNGEVFADLPGDQQELLRDAAGATRDRAVDAVVPDGDLASDFCAAGGRVVHAAEADLAAFEAAVEPVYAELEEDPATADLIAGIREIKEGLPAPATAAPCGEARPDGDAGNAGAGAGAEGGTGDDPQDAAAFPEGVYRAEMTVDDLRDRGLAVGEADGMAGVSTLTIEDGRWLHSILGKENLDCGGTYTVAGGRITLEIEPACPGTPVGFVVFSATWTAEGDELRFADFGDEHDLQDFNEATWGGQPWTRVE